MDQTEAYFKQQLEEFAETRKKKRKYDKPGNIGICERNYYAADDEKEQSNNVILKA